MPENMLRGRIIAMYHTVLNFANAIGWSNRKAYDIVNGKQEPTCRDIEEMCSALKVDIPQQMKELFFTQ